MERELEHGRFGNVQLGARVKAGICQGPAASVGMLC